MIKTYFLDINKLKKDFSYEEVYNMVSPYRKEKVDRLRFENDKWLSLGAEFLLIEGLKELKIDYSKIELELKKIINRFLKIVLENFSLICLILKRW